VIAIVKTYAERLGRSRGRSAQLVCVVGLRGVAALSTRPGRELRPAVIDRLRVGAEPAAAGPFHVQGAGAGQDDQPAIKVADPHGASRSPRGAPPGGRDKFRTSLRRPRGPGQVRSPGARRAASSHICRSPPGPHPPPLPPSLAPPSLVARRRLLAPQSRRRRAPSARSRAFRQWLGKAPEIIREITGTCRLNSR